MAEDTPRRTEQKVEIGEGSVAKNIFQVVIEHLTLGIHSLPVDYTPAIKNFLTEYLGTPEEPVPFGGREREMAQLTEWLTAPDAPPYLLLTAPAGRGKSALLVRWMTYLQETMPDLNIVFVPVSIRFDTALASATFAILAARLAAIHGDPISTGPNTPDAVWRGLASQYMSRPLPDGRQVLIILDGVDEAANWDVSAALFPRRPLPGLRAIVSARLTFTRPTADHWRRALGWESRRLARAMTLKGLGMSGIRDVLEKMGVPLNELSRNVDIVRELYRLSEGGDPLLINLYVQRLWEERDKALALTPEDLRSISPGYEGYFDRWWEDQRKLWGDKAPLKERAVQEVFSLLAVARGPLPAADLLRLAAEDSGLNALTLEDTLKPLARLVIGDATRGYVFSHPRLADYFREDLRKKDPRYLEAVEARFLAWGRETMEALREGRLAPGQVSSYVLRYYRGHLEAAGADWQAFLPLVEVEGWARAWHHLEGTYSGYLGDVDAVWERAKQADAEATATGDVVPALGTEIRCALIKASIHSLASNIPPELLAALVEYGVWPSPVALVHARLVLDERARARALAALAPHLPPDLLAQALKAAQAIEREDARARALAALAPLWTQVPRQQAYALWAKTWPALAARRRDDLLFDLTALAPVIAALGGENAVRETFQAIQDVSRWWP